MAMATLELLSPNQREILRQGRTVQVQQRNSQKKVLPLSSPTRALGFFDWQCGKKESTEWFVRKTDESIGGVLNEKGPQAHRLEYLVTRE